MRSIRNLEDNCCDVPASEEIFPVLEVTGVIAFFFVVGLDPTDDRNGVASEEIRRQPDIGGDIILGLDLLGLTLNQDFTRGTARRLLACSSANLVALNVGVLVTIRVTGITELEVERHILVRVTIEVEAKRVEAFLVEDVWHG